jgi:hypothetical protein
MKFVPLALILVLTIGAAPALPQEKPDSGAVKSAPSNPFQTTAPILKFIELKHLMSDNERLDRVITLIRLLNISAVNIVHDSQLKTLALRGTPEEIARVEELLKRFDVPAPGKLARQIQITIHTIEATDQPGESPALPPNLTSAVEQLRTAFGYKGFRLMDTILLQGREGSELELTGMLPITATQSSEKTFYVARYARAGYNDAQKTLFVNGFKFNIRIPVSSGEHTTYGDSGITTDLSIRDGQKLVLGKLTKDQTPGTGVFLILTAKVD